MSYIITAEVQTDTEPNMHGIIEKVDARVLSRRSHSVTFDVTGKFGEERERVLAICTSLVDAGFFEFSIGHSY